MIMDEKELEEMRMAFVGVWDFIGRTAPKLFVEIRELKKERDHWKEASGQGDLDKVTKELVLLRGLEAADRRADENNCRKSLNQKAALLALDDFRGTDPDQPEARQPKRRRKG